MSSNTDTQLDPKEEQIASTEPKLAQQETDLVTHPKGDESSTTEQQPPTITEQASNVAATVTSTAANMKDSVFSMFGGGVKKEKKQGPEDEVNEPSGSNKAKKEAEKKEADGDEDVSCLCCYVTLSRSLKY